MFAMKALLVTLSLSNYKEAEMLEFRPTLINNPKPESVISNLNILLHYTLYLIRVSVSLPFTYKTKGLFSVSWTWLYCEKQVFLTAIIGYVPTWMDTVISLDGRLWKPFHECRNLLLKIYDRYDITRLVNKKPILRYFLSETERGSVHPVPINTSFNQNWNEDGNLMGNRIWKKEGSKQCHPCKVLCLNPFPIQI